MENKILSLLAQGITTVGSLHPRICDSMNRDVSVAELQHNLHNLQDNNEVMIQGDSVCIV